MFNSVTNWWLKEPSSSPQESSTVENDAGDKVIEPGNTGGETYSVVGEISSPVEHSSTTTTTTTESEEVSVKAMNAARDWGNYFYSFGKKATETAMKTAAQLKGAVEDKTIIGQFNKEQERFVSENLTRKKTEEAAVPPWIGYNEEESIKKQILALSADKRNFLRNPPAGVQFSFDFQTASPVARVMLQEDTNLKIMRFELVPKQINEEHFWRNYFYRISLIKQSAELSFIAQQTGSDAISNKSSRTSSSESLHKDKPEAVESVAAEPDELPTASPPEHEFASDAFQESHFNEEDLKKEMQMLGMAENKGDKQTTSTDDDLPEWERELQAELQEYEVVDDGTNLDDADLEKELLQQIEAEAHQQAT